jgi:hypothetical protein
VKRCQGTQKFDPCRERSWRYARCASSDNHADWSFNIVMGIDY